MINVRQSLDKEFLVNVEGGFKYFINPDGVKVLIPQTKAEVNFINNNWDSVQLMKRRMQAEGYSFEELPEVDIFKALLEREGFRNNCPMGTFFEFINSW